MSQSEVNDLKQFINQLVLGSAQTYINIMKSEIIQLIGEMKLELVDLATIQIDEVKELVNVQGLYMSEILNDILTEVRELEEWDESELIG